MSILKFLLNSGFKPTLRGRLQPVTGAFKVSPLMTGSTANAVLEASIVPDTSNVKIYFTRSSGANTNVICMATTNNVGGDWTFNQTPIIGLGAAGEPSNRQANSSCVFNADGYFYCTATDGYGAGNLYLYRSNDGITWTDLGLLVDKSAVAGASGFGNSAVWGAMVNGKFEMLLEALVGGVWQISRFSSVNIESGWTLTNAMPGLQVAAGGMVGGAQLIYNAGVWHILYHYAPVAGNTPTYLGYAISDDLVTIVQKEHPLFGIETQPYGSSTDQIADPWLQEVNGKCYLLAEYVKTTNEAQIWIWTYDGTFDELIANT